MTKDGPSKHYEEQTHTHTRMVDTLQKNVEKSIANCDCTVKFLSHDPPLVKEFQTNEDGKTEGREFQEFQSRIFVLLGAHARLKQQAGIALICFVVFLQRVQNIPIKDALSV